MTVPKCSHCGRTGVALGRCHECQALVCFDGDGSPCPDAHVLTAHHPGFTVEFNADGTRYWQAQTRPK